MQAAGWSLGSEPSTSGTDLASCTDAAALSMWAPAEGMGALCVARSTHAAHKQKSPHTCSCQAAERAGCHPGSQTNGKVLEGCPDLALGLKNIFPDDLRCVVAGGKKCVFSPQKFIVELCFLSSLHMKGYNLLWVFLRMSFIFNLCWCQIALF